MNTAQRFAHQTRAVESFRGETHARCLVASIPLSPIKKGHFSTGCGRFFTKNTFLSTSLSFRLTSLSLYRTRKRGQKGRTNDFILNLLRTSHEVPLWNQSGCFYHRKHFFFIGCYSVFYAFSERRFSTTKFRVCACMYVLAWDVMCWSVECLLWPKNISPAHRRSRSFVIYNNSIYCRPNIFRRAQPMD